MNSKFHDPIVAEVRKIREDILAEFNGDMDKYHQYLAEQRPALEAAGVHYETQEERQARLAWKKQQDSEAKK